MRSVTATASSSTFSGLLGLREPWRIQAVRTAADRKSLELHIGITEIHKDWLGRTTYKAVEAPKQVWRHLDVVGVPTYVHVYDNGTPDLDQQSWAAPIGQPFTSAMASHLVELLCSGMDLGAICKVHDINLEVLWRFKVAAEHERVALLPWTSASALKNKGQRRASGSAKSAASGAATVPAPDSGVWKRLATGQQELETDVLGLRLLLARTKSDFNDAQDDESRERKLGKLHRYFEKNAQQLAHELGQLNEVPA